MSARERQELADRFYTALTSRDWAAFRSLLAADVKWTVPGNAEVSGQIEGPDPIADRFRSVAEYGVNFALERVMISRDNMALAFHNTAKRDGRRLDMHVVTVCRLSGNKIDAMETFVSDVDQLETFFV